MWASRGILVAWLLAVGCGGSFSGDDDDQVPAPRIDELLPATARAGEMVEVVGSGFCGDAGTMEDGETCATPVSGIVSFGIGDQVARGTVVSWKAGRIQVTVPPGLPAGVTSVVVTVSGVPSNAVDLTIIE